jgi:hypothetical protein
MELPHARARARERQGPREDGALRYALIGWLFASEQRLELDGGLVHRLQSAGQLMADTAITIVRHALLSPRRGQRAARIRDEKQLEQWIALGRVEEAHSRRLASVAVREAIDELIGYLATKPEIRDLVRSQGSGFAHDVAGGVRERSATADSMLENVARSLLRRPPRTEEASPPAPRDHPLAPQPVADTGQVP